MDHQIRKEAVISGEKEPSSSLARVFFFSFLSFFFFNIHQGIIMGQLNSDSSLCKWHLNAGKQLTKGLQLGWCLRIHSDLASMLWVSLGLPPAKWPATSLWPQRCYYRASLRMEIGCVHPVGVQRQVLLQQWNSTASWTTHILRQNSLPPTKPGCGFSLLTPPLIRLSTLLWLLAQTVSSFSSNSRPTFPTKSTSLTNPQEPTYSHLISCGTHKEYCTPGYWNLFCPWQSSDS